MAPEIISLFVLLSLFIFLIGSIFLIAFLAAKSRKNKQKKLLQTIPSNCDFHAFVRFNRGDQQDKILKFKAFQGSGILYLQGKILGFKSTTGFDYTFDLSNSQLFWEGENLVNGLLKWFSIKDHSEKMFFNVETGMFIFHTGGNKPTTRSIYNKIALRKSEL